MGDETMAKYYENQHIESPPNEGLIDVVAGRRKLIQDDAPCADCGTRLADCEAELTKLPGFWRDAEKSLAEAKRLLKEAGQEDLAFKFLNRAGIRFIQGDQREALSWYRRAWDLGDAEADRLLKTLEPH